MFTSLHEIITPDCANKQFIFTLELFALSIEKSTTSAFTFTLSPTEICSLSILDENGQLQLLVKISPPVDS